MSEDSLTIVWIVAAAAAVVALIFLARWMAKKRIAALAAAANGLGFSFSPERKTELAARMQKLYGISPGSDDYAENLLLGTYRGHAVTVFEFNNTTKSTDSDNQTKTEHHSWHIVFVDLGRSFPGLVIEPENSLTKLGKVVGIEDIEVESREFSKKFSIRSDDPAFANEVCHARLTDFLLGQPAVIFEISDRFLAFVHPNKIIPSRLQKELDLALDVRERLPDHLFVERHPSSFSSA